MGGLEKIFMGNNHDQERSAAAEGCSICQRDLTLDYGNGFSSNYPNMVCGVCSRKAVNAKGHKPAHNSMGDWGDNPVFIDDIKCWRRYRFGGFVTMRDYHDCPSITDFYAVNRDGLGF